MSVVGGLVCAWWWWKVVTEYTRSSTEDTSEEWRAQWGQLLMWSSFNLRADDLIVEMDEQSILLGINTHSHVHFS